MSQANLAILGGAVAFGGVVILYGVKGTKSALAATPTPGSSASPLAGGTGSVAPGASGKLNGNQQAFASRLQADTGLDPAVIAGWVLAEEPASSSAAPNGANNWLNIGAFDSGSWSFGGSSVWSDPATAADATAAFIAGHPVNGVTPPAFGSTGIRRIASEAGNSINNQISAIQSSGWATSGYPDLPGLVEGFKG